MAVENLKSTAITNADAVPAVQNPTGNGAAGILREVDGYATVSASASVTSTYRLCRIPTNAKVKAVNFESEAQGAGKFDLSVYYSDGPEMPASLSGIIVPSTGNQFFASDIDCTSAVTPTNVTNESGNYTLNKRGMPLWQALGLTTDPGGNFDIVAVVHTTAVTTGTGKIGVRCTYVD